jgi:hypothetical protein
MLNEAEIISLNFFSPFVRTRQKNFGYSWMIGSNLVLNFGSLRLVMDLAQVPFFFFFNKLTPLYSYFLYHINRLVMDLAQVPFFFFV